MYGGPAIPPGARPVERGEDSKVYPGVTVIAGVVFVLLLIGIVIALRWLGGGEETVDSLQLLAVGR